MKLLKTLCSIHAPSGNEEPMTNFLLDHINKNQKKWLVQPDVFYGKGFQNCIVLAFGKPRTAVFAHMDSIGFTIRYGKQLVKIGSPVVKSGYELTGSDENDFPDCTLQVKAKNDILYKFKKELSRGIDLTFKPNFRETKSFVQCCYMDNRLGVWNALQLAKSLKNGIIAFSCWEEHGGGSVGYLGKFIYEKYNVSQALISDITWVTSGVRHGRGVAISLRDSGIPRRIYKNKIHEIAEKSSISFQLEVESIGGSDGNYLQASPYPFDWCFIGAPESNVHTPDEKVHKDDIQAMVEMYKLLMDKL